jgi:hypothetical protein
MGGLRRGHRGDWRERSHLKICKEFGEFIDFLDRGRSGGPEILQPHRRTLVASFNSDQPATFRIHHITYIPMQGLV